MRIAIAEDSVLLRAGLVRLLEDEGIDVVSATGDGPSLLGAVRALHPDVAIVDIRLPPTFSDEGITTAVEIRRTCPQVGVMVLSQYVEDHYARDLLDTGPARVGYLLKQRVGEVEEFVGALHRVAAGSTVLDPEVVQRLLGRDTNRPLSTLTARERQVLNLMAAGRTNVAISAELQIADRTVEKHVTAILTKLKIPDGPHDHRRVLAVLAHLHDG